MFVFALPCGRFRLLMARPCACASQCAPSDVRLVTNLAPHYLLVAGRPAKQADGQVNSAANKPAARKQLRRRELRFRSFEFICLLRY